MFPKPALEHRDWKWVMMWNSWKIYCDLSHKVQYVDPDNFDMYVFNDFYSYGLHSLIEKKILEFDKEYRKKKDRSLAEIWSIVAALGHFLSKGEYLMQWLMIDDGARANAAVGLIGCAFLSALDEIDQACQLTADSQFLDLGLVMSLYLEWSRGLEGYGIGDDGDALDWREQVLAYAKKAGIDLNATGICCVQKSLDEFIEVRALKTAKAGRWKWTKNFGGYKVEYGFGNLHGVPGYDITKWPRSLRAKYNFDKKDPLADVSEADLKADKIEIA